MSMRKQIPASSVPHVQADLCHVCKKCLAREACDSKAVVRIDRDEPPFIDASRCYGCRACILACPFGAIALPVQAPTREAR